MVWWAPGTTADGRHLQHAMLLGLNIDQSTSPYGYVEYGFQKTLAIYWFLQTAFSLGLNKLGPVA